MKIFNNKIVYMEIRKIKMQPKNNKKIYKTLFKKIKVIIIKAIPK